MRKCLVSLALVAVLGLSAGVSSFTGAQETESPEDLSGSCLTLEATPDMDGTPGLDGTPGTDATPGGGTPGLDATPDLGTPEVDATTDGGTPEGTPGTSDATPNVDDCATPESTPDV